MSMHHSVMGVARVTLDEARMIGLFSGLPEQQLLSITSRLQTAEFAPGKVIMSRTLPAEHLYFVLAGRVRVELQDDSGQIFNLAEFGPGEFFGERAILTSEPRTADVRAITGVRTAALSRTDFEALLHETPRLYANLCRDLSRLLGTWAQRHQREERENREIITSVIGWQLLPEFEEFPGSSPWVMELNRRLRQLGGSAEHILISGEPGTWKDLAARLVHFYGDPAKPVLFLDCAAPPPVTGGRDGGSAPAHDALLLEICQEAALFGHTPDSTVYARRARRGMLELASGGDLILRNVDSLTAAIQNSLTAFIESGTLKRRGENGLRRASVRIIATSGEDLHRLVEQGTFSRRLLELLSRETIVMAPLRERKKDIPVIASSLLRTLNAKHHKNIRRFSHDAMNRLLDHSWPLNGSELYQVVSRAVIVCPGDEILAEQIFLHEQPFSSGRFNLLSVPAIENLARTPDVPQRLRWVTVPLFIVIMISTLTGSAYGNAANLAVWALWWPALVVTGFVFARGWCSYCPLEAIGAFIGTGRWAHHEPAALLRRWGPVFGLAGMAGIILLEQGTGMFEWAFATGLLLLGLLIAAIAGDLVLGKRGWCKYLCPLGRIVSLMSRISLLNMHSNRTVCISRCRVDECVKEKGCPMDLHPTGISGSDHCILCLNCVRHCPHHAMQLDLRNPAQGLYDMDRYAWNEALFSVTLVGIIIAAKATPLLYGHKPEIFPARIWEMREFAGGLMIVAAITSVTMLATILTSGRRWTRIFAAHGLAYLPLAAAGLFMVYFRAFVEGGAQLVPLLLQAVRLDRWVDVARLTPELGTFRLVIYPLLLAAAVFSMVALTRRHEKTAAASSGLWLQRLLMGAVTAAFIKLL